MLKWYKALDKDQQATITSSMIVVLFAVCSAIFLPTKAMLFIFPFQFLVTYFLFCSKEVSCSHTWCIDGKSSKRWLASSCAWFPNIGITLSALFAAIAIGYQSKFISTIALLCPLLITRGIIFVRKLPLAALYADMLLKNIKN